MNTNRKGEIEMEKLNYKGDVATVFTTTHIKPRRLDIYWIDLGKGNGSIQGGLRPCIVTTNDMANKFSPVIQVAPITSMTKKKLSTHVNVKQGEAGLSKDSTTLLEQNMPVNKTQIRSYIGTITDREVMYQINMAIKIQMGVC